MESSNYIVQVAQHMLLVALHLLAGSLELWKGASVGEGHIDRLVDYTLLIVCLTSLSPNILLEVLVVDGHVLVTVLLQFLLVF